mgnify:CR=1 FL=1
MSLLYPNKSKNVLSKEFSEDLLNLYLNTDMNCDII